MGKYKRNDGSFKKWDGKKYIKDILRKIRKRIEDHS